MHLFIVSIGFYARARGGARAAAGWRIFLFSFYAILRNKATTNHRLRTNGALEESHSNERLRVSNWIVQRLYNYAVKETVER